MGTHPIFESDFDCLTVNFSMNRIVTRCASERAKTIQSMRGKIGAKSRRTKFDQVLPSTQFESIRISSHFKANEEANLQKSMTKEQVTELHIKRMREAANDKSGTVATIMGRVIVVVICVHLFFDTQNIYDTPEMRWIGKELKWMSSLVTDHIPNSTEQALLIFDQLYTMLFDVIDLVKKGIEKLANDS